MKKSHNNEKTFQKLKEKANQVYTGVNVSAIAAIFEAKANAQAVKPPAKTTSRKSSLSITSGYGTDFSRTRSRDVTHASISYCYSEPSDSNEINSETRGEGLLFNSCSKVYVQIGKENNISDATPEAATHKKTIIDVTESIIEKFKDKDTLQSNCEFDKAMQIFHHNGVVIIKGSNRSGKTLFAKKIFTFLSGDFDERYCIETPKDLHQVINPGRRQLIFIDEMFGMLKQLTRRFEDWDINLKFLASCLKKGKVRLIITLTDEVLAQYIDRLKEFPCVFGKQNMIDLDLLRPKQKDFIDKELPIYESPLVNAVRKGQTLTLKVVIRQKNWTNEEIREGLVVSLTSCTGTELIEICHLLLEANPDIKENVRFFAIQATKIGDLKTLNKILGTFNEHIDDYTQGRILYAMMAKLKEYHDTDVSKIIEQLTGKKVYFKTEFLRYALTSSKKQTLRCLLKKGIWVGQELEDVLFETVGIVPKTEQDIYDIMWEAGTPLNTRFLKHVAKLKKIDLMRYILQKRKWSPDELSEVLHETIKISDKDEINLEMIHLLVDQGTRINYNKNPQRD